MPVPWKQILTSVPLYLNISVQTGGLWSLFTLLTHAPTYFRFIHGWNNRMVSSESLTDFFFYVAGLLHHYFSSTFGLMKGHVELNVKW